MSRPPVHVQIAHEWVEASLDKAADLDDLDATRTIAQTVRAWLASVDALDNLPTSTDILACQRWRNNAEMIAAVLGLLDDTGQIPAGPWVDLTYGEHGGWWLPGFNPAPSNLVRCIGPDTTGYDTVPMWHDDEGGGLLGPGVYRIDFRRAPFTTGQFAVVAYDPPYVLKGGKGAYDAMNSRYGVGLDTLAGIGQVDDAQPKNRREQLTDLIVKGFAETLRITKRGGIILAKGGAGVDGGKPFYTDDLLTRLADNSPSIERVARLIFPTVPRSQVHRGKQQSVRNNYSTLLVLRKVK